MLLARWISGADGTFHVGSPPFLDSTFAGVGYQQRVLAATDTEYR